MGDPWSHVKRSEKGRQLNVKKNDNHYEQGFIENKIPKKIN